MDQKTADRISEIVLSINNEFKLLSNSNLISQEDEHLMKHLAACSIHAALFMREIASNVLGNKNTKTEFNEYLESKFLNECGCGFNDEKMN